MSEKTFYILPSKPEPTDGETIAILEELVLKKDTALAAMTGERDMLHAKLDQLARWVNAVDGQTIFFDSAKIYWLELRKFYTDWNEAHYPEVKK